MKPLRLIDFPPPKWKKWRNIPEVEFWQGAALVFNIEPDALQNYTSWHGSAFRVMDLVVPEELRDLYEILMRNAKKIDPKWRGSTRVNLRRLGRFVSSLEEDGFNLPEEFPRILPDEPQDTGFVHSRALKEVLNVARDFYRTEPRGKQKDLAKMLGDVLWESPSTAQKLAMTTLAGILQPDSERLSDERMSRYRFDLHKE